MSDHFFPRGPGPLISVLMSTRGRPKPLCQAVDSLFSLAKDKSRLEFIFKADDDDKETISVIEKMEKVIPVKKIISPRGRGYHQIHEWLDQKASLATGDWLFIFNDDAVMASKDWDEVMLHMGTSRPWIGIEDVALVVAQTEGRPFAQEFFFLRRRTFEILGHISKSPHGDNWIYGVMKFIGAAMEMHIVVKHFSGEIGDQTRADSVEAYKTAIDTLTSIEARREQAKDVNKLLDYMSFRRASMPWQKDPPELGWCWWREKAGAKPVHCYVKQGLAIVIEPGGQPDPKESWTIKERGGEWSLK